MNSEASDTAMSVQAGAAEVSATAAGDDVANPVADPRAVVEAGRARFTVLTPQMIRIQYSEKRSFEDRATFAVVNRRLPVPRFTTSRRNGYLTITTDALTLRYRLDGDLSAAAPDSTALTVSLDVAGRKTLWHPGLHDPQNLKGTTRTLDGQLGDNKRGELEDGLLSRSGWAIIDESPRHRRGDGSTTFAFDGRQHDVAWLSEPVDKDATDWYFLGYGHDYRRCLGDFIRVAGRQPMPPLFVLGYWYSKYQRYTSSEFMEIADDVRRNDIPMDVMIMDMDWHTQGWTGWTWDKSAIPDPEGLISDLHKRGLRVALNLHPADGVDADEDFFADIRSDMGLPSDAQVVPWQLSDGRFYETMFEHIIRERERQGVDFWWIDWQQNLTSKFVDGLGETFWCNHVFYNDMRSHRRDRRPLIFHRWGGLGCHRYPIGFSGDANSTFPTLAWQPYFTATASNVCFGYWGHDLGGHIQHGPNDPELYLRWMQFGVYTPIFRTHATNWAGIERRIWKYDNFPLLRAAVCHRYALMPYIYTACRQAYDTGVSICRPLYYYWPEFPEAYEREDEYLFGDDILVAPVTTASDADGLARRTTWLPEGRWYDVCRRRLVDGPTVVDDAYSLSETPVFVRAGAIVVNNPPIPNLNVRPDRLIVKVVPGADGSCTLYEDEGDSEAYQHGAYATTLFLHATTAGETTLTIHPRQGAYADMPAARAYTVEFLATDRPTEVYVGDRRLSNGSWLYDATTHTVSVFVGTRPCSQVVTVRLRH